MSFLGLLFVRCGDVEDLQAFLMIIVGILIGNPTFGWSAKTQDNQTSNNALKIKE